MLALSVTLCWIYGLPQRHYRYSVNDVEVCACVSMYVCVHKSRNELCGQHYVIFPPLRDNDWW